jgi:PBSX family phage terminase large subunit
LFLARDPSEDAFQNYLIGSVRSGKTWTMMVKLLLLCKYPVAGRRLIIGHSKDTLMRNVLTDLFSLVGTKNYQYNLQSGALKLFDVDWHCIAAHDDASFKAIQGSTVGIAVIDEVVNTPESFFEMLLSRLSLPGSRLYATSNPGPPNHWLKIRLDDPALKQDCWLETFDLDDNLSLTQDVKDRLRRSFTGVFYQRYILGRWVNPEGLIFKDCFDESCLYDDDSAPAGLLQARRHERFVGCDVGTVNQHCYLDCIDTGKVVYIDREWVWDSKLEQRQLTNGQYADELVKWMPPDALVIVDPAAAGFKAELNFRGIWNQDADNDVLPGIQLMSGLFSLGLLKIHRRCQTLIKQLEGYSWDEKAIARTGKEAPIKIADHLPDCARYICKTKITEWRLAA